MLLVDSWLTDFRNLLSHQSLKSLHHGQVAHYGGIANCVSEIMLIVVTNVPVFSTKVKD